MRTLVVLLAAALLLPSAAAYPDPDNVPSYFHSSCYADVDRRFVFDYLGMLDADMGAQIEGAACDIYRRTSAHFVLVTVDNTENEPLESYALHLFENWGVGDKERLDGVMLLFVRNYAMGGASSAVRVEVGYGLEDRINSFAADDAIDAMRDAKARALEAGESEAWAYSFALATGAHRILTVLNGDAEADSQPPFGPVERSLPSWKFYVTMLVIFILVSYVLARTMRGSGGKPGWGYQHNPGAWGSSWSGGSGGFGGGGGGGFGGGRSGGGGGSGGL
jgi:uncharacterized protein